jgi:diadenosine tetraphosphate (Ap4A) HIT family hydrolase
MTKEKSFLLNNKLLNETKLICDIPLCKFLLMNDSNYPLVILVPRRPNIFELFDLSKEDRIQLDHETVVVSKFINDSFKPDKINIATLGNIVSQFHVHIIARFSNDNAWPEPVWGKFPPKKYTSRELKIILNKFGKLSEKFEN